jgi:hypothetical protein
MVTRQELEEAAAVAAVLKKKKQATIAMLENKQEAQRTKTLVKTG